MVKYRIRFCCDTCCKWDLLDWPIPYLISRHDSWFDALDALKKLQCNQFRSGVAQNAQNLAAKPSEINN